MMSDLAYALRMLLKNPSSTAVAVSALLLAAVGIYSTISLYVSSRTKEFGIRLALGAQPARLRLAVLGQAMILTAAVLPWVLRARWY